MLTLKKRTGTFTAAGTPAAVNINIGFVPDFFQMIGEVTAAGDIAKVTWLKSMGDTKALQEKISIDSGSTGNKSEEFISSGGISAYTKSSLSPARWKASTAYVVGQVVHPVTLNGYFYKCTTAGTSGGSEPTWGTTVGGTTSDNTAVWTCIAMGDLTNGADVEQFNEYGVSVPSTLQKASTKYHWIAIGEDTQ